MKLPNSQDLMAIARRTLNQIDPRLVDHGERVAGLVYKALVLEGGHSPQELRDSALTAFFHDVGAYKTEEIDHMVQFESSRTLSHCVYGYLFLRFLSPLADKAEGVLFHHTPFEQFSGIGSSQKELAQLIHLADRIDILTELERREVPAAFWEETRNTQFSPRALELMRQVLAEGSFSDLMENGVYRQTPTDLLGIAPFTRAEIDAYLRMIVFSIDFRSHHTVTHTITTERISLEIASMLGFSPEELELVRYGALLHDLGKIAIPVEILEFPGKLSPQAMTVMKTHVAITGDILGERIDPEITRIALRHHEKLDGSGYPLHLTGDILTPAQRVVAVADIVSALHGTRSYKTAFGKEKILSVLQEMKTAGKLCPQVVDLTCAHYDQIMGNVETACTEVLEMYNHIQSAHEELMVRYAGL